MRKSGHAIFPGPHRSAFQHFRIGSLFSHKLFRRNRIHNSGPKMIPPRPGYSSKSTESFARILRECLPKMGQYDRFRDRG